jgi:hypothetical protein
MHWVWQLLVLATATTPEWTYFAWQKWPPLGVGVALIGVLVLVGCVVAWYSPFAFTLGRTTAPAGPVRDDMAISEISLTGTDSAS